MYLNVYESLQTFIPVIEKGVDRVALYREMDIQQIVEFQVLNNTVHFESNPDEEMLQFRNECQAHETDMGKII